MGYVRGHVDGPSQASHAIHGWLRRDCSEGYEHNVPRSLTLCLFQVVHQCCHRVTMLTVGRVDIVMLGPCVRPTVDWVS